MLIYKRFRSLLAELSSFTLNGFKCFTDFCTVTGKLFLSIRLMFEWRIEFVEIVLQSADVYKMTLISPCHRVITIDFFISIAANIIFTMFGQVVFFLFLIR